MEFGRFAYYSILVANAAHVGAQYGAQNVVTAADTTGITNAVKGDGQSLAGLTSTSITPVVECGCTGATLSSPCPATGAIGCSSPGHPLVYIQVTVSGTISSMFKYPGIPQSLPLTSTVTMRVGQ
jgi:hypothetical protein